MDTNEHELISKADMSGLSEVEKKQSDRLSVFKKIVAVFAGVILPIVAFGLGFIFKPDWQSKTWESYMAMLLTPWATWPFYPMILYSMVCLCLTLFMKRASMYFAARLGVYVGIFWSFQYLFILPFSIGDSGGLLNPVTAIICGIFAILIPIGIWFLLKYISSKIHKVLIFIFALILLAVLIIVGVASEGFDFLNIIWGYPTIVSLLASPFWCFAVYLFMSIYAYRHSGEARLILALKYKVLIGVAAIATYAVAWWLSIQSMLAEYSTLPTEPPDCYIATAAARGHRRFVKSEDVILTDGKVMRVNAQLRYLKCGELMIKAVFPKIHKLMRKIYDTIGPLLACCLAWPILADVTYILLKPAEWMVCGVLFVLFGRECNIAKKFYN